MVGGSAQADLLNGEDWSALNDADIVVFGEVHDNPHHHTFQAAAVAALRPATLVFEHLTPELADRATPALRDDPVALEAALEWETRGWPEFDWYYPIFTAAPEAKIIGGGAPITAVRQAIGDGAASVFGPEGNRFGLDRAYPKATQANLEDVQRQAHCEALPEEMLPGMVEAQRYRDAVLANAAQKAAVLGPVVVITGNGHADNNWAVPWMLRQADPDLVVVSVGQSEVEPPAPGRFDFWLVSRPVERGDPCDAFR